MRVGAQWVQEEAPFDDDDAWIGVGYIVSDVGAVLLVVSLVLAGVGLRRAGEGRGRTAARVVTVVTLLLVAAYLVAMWAMTTKPT